MIHGGGSKYNSANRWYDKCLQLIVNRNGMNGLNYEHTSAEALPMIAIADFVFEHLEAKQTVDENVNLCAENYSWPVKLPFKTSDKLKNYIKVAASKLDEASANIEFNVVNFKCYGKNFIKSQNMSPDSYIQMAMQYAFYKFHGEPGAHYESAQTRMFVHGRTEAIRSCSIESLAFAKAMCDSSVSNPDKVAALRAAVNAHKNYAVMASNGYGIDRHLLGLKLLAHKLDITIPDLFTDEAYVKSSCFRMTTSQVSSNNNNPVFVCYAPHGPFNDDGYGICYHPRNDDIFLTVSAFNSCPTTSAKLLGDHLIDAFEHMHRLLSEG